MGVSNSGMDHLWMKTNYTNTICGTICYRSAIQDYVRSVIVGQGHWRAILSCSGDFIDNRKNDQTDKEDV